MEGSREEECGVKSMRLKNRGTRGVGRGERRKWKQVIKRLGQIIKYID